MMKRYVLALDLVDEVTKIQAYEQWHQQVWPEVKDAIRQSGIHAMEIYRFQNRLMMIMEVEEAFSFAQKAALDAGNKRVQEWELLMEDFQQRIPGTAPGEKWVLMDKIFELNK